MDGITAALARRGWRCRTLATTLSDAAQPIDLPAILRGLGVPFRREPVPGSALHCTRFEHRGVGYTLLEVPQAERSTWLSTHELPFNSLLDAELTLHRPDVVHTFGAAPQELARQQRCRAHGSAVVLSVRNHGYYDPRAFAHCDAVVTPSRFMADRLFERTGVRATPLSMPMDWSQVQAPQRRAVFVTFVNPTREKGVLFFARLAEDLAARRPDIPLLVFESRGSAGLLVAAGLAGGFDLRRHESLLVSPPVSGPREVFANTRVLLVPSVWEEPSARVSAEALLNAVPAIVSDRGGMGESLHGGGFVLPLPSACTPDALIPPPPGAADEWIRLIERLCDDEAFYAEQSARALAAAEHYRPERQETEYDAFFGQLVRPSGPPRITPATTPDRPTGNKT
jgi:glycosyltransferase involved in cell wall biosynthesis